MQPEQDHENNQDHRNPGSRADKQKEFQTAGVMKDIYTKAIDMYEATKRYEKTIKMVKNDHPRVKGLQIIDFSLSGRGPVEDQIYIKYPFYRNNIRRGNTLVYNAQNKTAFWARKGLIKFFDLYQESINAIIEEEVKQLDDKKQENHYVIFSEIENVLSCNQEISEQGKAAVDIFRLNKANGENAQVSYFLNTQEWVIASKNVAIFVKDKNDFKYYNSERYQFAKLIASTWFDMVADYRKQDLELLKKDCIGKTLVGEYCGNPDYQHLVKYDKTIIYFYAIVENQGTESCIPPNQAFQFFQKHKIPIVKNHEKSHVGRFTSFVDLGKGLDKTFRNVATSSIFQQEQGSVVYFVLNQTKQFCEYISDRYLQKTVPIPENWENLNEIRPKVVALSKMKTLQYRLLRKLREKLKYFTRVKKGGEMDEKKKQDEQKKFQQKYGSFEKQSKQLLKGEKLSKPIQYYFCIAMVAFDYMFKNKKSSKAVELFTQHFLDFLSVIFWCVEHKKEVTPNHMNDKQLIEQLRQTNWGNYSAEIVDQYENMLQKIVPRYWKNKQTMKEQEQHEFQKEEQENDD